MHILGFYEILIGNTESHKGTAELEDSRVRDAGLLWLDSCTHHNYLCVQKSLHLRHNVQYIALVHIFELCTHPRQ